MRSSCSLLLALLLVVSSTASALDPVALDHEGREGIWLPTSDMSKLLGDLAILNQQQVDQKTVIDLQVKVIDLQASTIHTATIALSKSDVLIDRMAANEERLTQALAEEDSFFRKPIVNFIAGAALVLASVGLGVFASK